MKSRVVDYLDFEKSVTVGVEKLFRHEPEGTIRERIRQECLRQRIWARDTWVDMGNTIPNQLRFEEPK